MTFADAMALAMRNLRQAKLRTFLTTLGVAIGIASLTGMVSLGVGLQDQFVGRFMRAGVFDSISVVPGAADPRGFLAGGRGRGGRGGRRGRGNAEGQRPLDDAVVRELAALDHVRDAYPLIRVPVEVKYGEDSEFVQALGVPMSSRGQGSFQKIAHGRFFASDDEAACMLSLAAARRLDEANPGSLIGKELTIGYVTAQSGAVAVDGANTAMQVQRVEARLPIVGIVERETGPGLGGNQVAPLMIPLGRAREMNAHIVRTQGAMLRMGNSGSYQTITVKVTHPQHTQDVQERIKQMGFAAFSLNDALEGAKRAFLIIDIILGLVGSIALAVASLGIVNTMVMSILERTREIGIMKAIGGSDGDVRRIFLIEASVIGVIGGVAGIALGWLVGRIINFGANQYIVSQGGDPGNLFSLPLWLIGSAIAFSIAVSLLAGSYPARRAARLDPIQALRHD